MSSKSKTFREEKRKNQKATGIGFLVIFALCATFFVVKFFVGMLPVTLTEQERIQIENTVLPELKSERKKVQERMDHRASIGGLYDQIGSTSRETWAQRYRSSLQYYDSLIDAFMEELKTGHKVAPPKRFRLSMGYETSEYRQYFTE